MAATTTFYEDNGTATGTPPKGATSTAISSIEYKSVDNTTTPRASAPITAGNNSFHKYNYLKFTGTFNQIYDVKFAHTSGTLGSGLTLHGKVTSTYATPATSTLSGTSDITAPSLITSGMAMLLSTVGPQGSSPTSAISATGYTQYFASQLRTTAAAAAGDTSTLELTIQYNEN